MKTPSCSSQITQSWVEFMLTNYECKKNPDSVIVVDHFNVASAVKPGESFNAELVKLDVNAKLKCSGQEVQDKTYHLIAKFLSRDPFNRQMIWKVGYHVKEFEMYSKVIKKLNEFQAEKTNNAYPIHVPEFIYGKCTPNEYVLVISNMKECGYGTNPKEKGLNLEQVQMAVNRIARLHGISYAYDKQHNFLSEFPCYTLNENISKLFKAVVMASINNAIGFLRTQKDLVSIADKLQSGKSNLPQKFEVMWEDQSRHSLLCLTHGDFWCSNLLFLNDQNGNPSEISFIDWQISQWNSPVMDLHYLLCTSTTAELRSQNLPQILQHYYSTFTSVTQALGCPVPNWSFAEFKLEFDRLSLVGFMMGVCLIQGTLSKAGEKLNKQATDDTASCCCGCLKNNVKNAVAKIAVPLAFHPSFHSLMMFSVKDLLKPIGRELIKGDNEVMNCRLTDLMKEADRNGLLDVLNM